MFTLSVVTVSTSTVGSMFSTFLERKVKYRAIPAAITIMAMIDQNFALRNVMYLLGIIKEKLVIINNGMNFLTIRILNLTFKDSKKFIPSVYFIYEIKLWVFTYAKVVNPVLTQGKMLTETSNV